MRRAACGLIVLGMIAACSGGRPNERAYAARLPPEVRNDFEVFAHRCSKCHPLARPLDSGIDDDGHWAMYVERMRRQPGSGISQEDTVNILRFLRYYAADRREQKKPKADTDAGHEPDGGAR